METETQTIADFLLACFAEDERDAKQALWFNPFHPERLLAECEAKRRIVAEHRIEPADGQDGCLTCNWTDDWGWGRTGPCETLLALAAVYADHDGFREEWRL